MGTHEPRHIVCDAGARSSVKILLSKSKNDEGLRDFGSKLIRNPPLPPKELELRTEDCAGTGVWRLIAVPHPPRIVHSLRGACGWGEPFGLCYD